MATKKKKEPESALQRINKGMDMAIDTGMPKDAIVLTLLAVEIQRLENRVNELEEKLSLVK